MSGLRLGRLPRLVRTSRQDGQAIIIVAIVMFVLIGMAGLVIDLGEIYLAKQHMQKSADAAALAAAAELPGDASSACTYGASAIGSACLDSSNGTQTNLSANGLNFSSNYANVQSSYALECLTSASAGTACKTGTACPGQYLPEGPPNSIYGCNAIAVTQKTTVTPFFMSLFGFGDTTVSATATAGIAGGAPHPLNVEVVDDATPSMDCPNGQSYCASGFTSSNICGPTIPTDVPSGVPLTQEDCAKAGIRALLTQLLPCYPGNATCPTSGNDETNAQGGPLDEVGLITFPGVLSNLQTGNDGQSVYADTNCLQDLSGSDETYTVGQANYQIVPFSSDYRYSDVATSPDPLATLNPYSNLVRAVYWPGDGCPNGGYPINSGGPATSISGGGSGDFTPASNTPSPSIAVGGTTRTTIGGITEGSSTSSLTTTATIAAGASSTSLASGQVVASGSSNTSVNSPSTIGGGASLSTDRSRAITTTTNPSSIAITPPSGYLQNTTFELVSVTARGLAGGSVICSPADGTWHAVGSATTGSGTSAITQATFWTTTSSTGSDTFTTGTSSGCTATTNASQISAVALVYTNVDATIPPLVTRTTGTTTGGSGGRTLTAPALSNVPANDMVISIFGANQAFSGTQPTYDQQGTGTNPVSTGADNNMQTTPGNAPQPTAAVSSTGVSWTAQTIALAPAPGTSITVTAATGYGSGGTNEGELVSIAVQGNVAICPQSATGWTALAATTTTSGGTVTEQAFWTTTGPTSYQFNFRQTNCSGALVNAGASALATIYTGVDESIAPTASVTNNPAASATLTAPTVTNTPANDMVVSLFATTDDYGGAHIPTVHNNPSSTWTNSGETPTLQQTTGNSASATATSGNSAAWAAETVLLTPLLNSSITVTAATGYGSGGTNEGELVSIAVQGNVAICPQSATGWTALAATTTTSGGTVTEQAFWTTTGPTSYQFNFRQTNCSGNVVKAGASALATIYTGVDESIAPTASVTNNPAASATLTAPTLTNTPAKDMVVSLFATTDDYGGAHIPTVHNNPSSTWTNSGETPTLQQTTGNSASATATSGNSAAWAAETVLLTPFLNSSITITPPAGITGYTPNSGDFLLTSIAVRGNVVICAPTGSNWAQIAAVSNSSGGNRLTQADFWTTASSSYVFTFYAASCGVGNPVKAEASAVATNYTGVDLAQAISAVGLPENTGSGSGSTLTAPSATTVNSYSEVVSTFGTLDSWASTTQPGVQDTPSGPSVNVGSDSAVQAAVGGQALGSQQTEHTKNPANWTGITVALSPLLSSSVTAAQPTGYVGGGADLMIVNIAVRNLGNGSICAPDGTWKPVPLSLGSPPTFTQTSGSVTQEAFYTSTSEAATDTFSFYSEPNCNGAPLGVAASAVTVYYTGVDTAAPLDVTPTSARGSSNAPMPAPITTQSAGDEIVTLFGSGGTSLGTTSSQAGNGFAPAVGVNNVNTGSPPPPPPTWTNPGLNAPPATTSDNANWTAETVALQPLLQNGIAVQRPQTNAAPNDFIVVTVTAHGLPASDNICAPRDGTWTELGGAMVTNGTTNQATWYSFRQGATAESYAFTFQSACSTSEPTLVSAAASAVAVRFSGVNPITPIDVNNSGTQIYSSQHSNGTTITPVAVTPFHTGDWVIAMYGAGGTTLTSTGCAPTTGSNPYTGFRSGSGSSTATGFCGKNNPSAGTSFTPPAATASAPSVAQTIALEASSSSCSNCVYGVEAPTNVNCGNGCTNYTNYAYAIQAATAQLQARQSTRPGAQNVIIILSDGDAGYPHQANYYPCNAGLQAAEAAENPAGLDVQFYSIAYGSNSSAGTSSCSIDNSASPSAPIIHNISALCTMKLMADNHISDAYSQTTNPDGYQLDTDAYTSLCTHGNNPTNGHFFNVSVGTSLEGIFQQIGSSLVTPRLISNNAA